MQHARPVGPAAQNTQATFSPEMAAGTGPPQRSPIRAAWKSPTHQRGMSDAQTTHVQAPFFPNMTIGNGILTPRSPIRAVWHTPGIKAGWSVAQPTHVQAPFSVDMIAGSCPISDINPLPPRGTTTAQSPDVLSFSNEMVIGWHPDRPRLFLAPRIPLPVGQTAQVDAPFGQEMIAGFHPDSPRPYVSPKYGWLISQPTPVAAPFSPDMVAGWLPPSPFLFTVRRVFGTQLLSQPTPVAAPFSPEMAAGVHPDRYRQVFPAPIGWQVAQVSQVDAPLSVEMVVGLASAAHLPFAAHTGILATYPDIPPFSVEMVIGWHPDRPCLFLAPRIPLPVSQPTHVSAPLSPDMMAGRVPPSPFLFTTRMLFGPQLLAQLTHVSAPVSPEMSTGSHPDRYRQLLPAIAGWQVVQSTQVDAPFSLEMAAGLASISHLPFAPKLGWQTAQTSHVAAPFSLDMVAGLLSYAHLPFRAHVGLVAATPDVLVFSVEMVIGWHPDQPRIFIAPRIPLPVSQPTHVQAAFSPDMVAGFHPDQPRPYAAPKFGLMVSQLSHVDAPITVDMLAGWVPNAGRGFAVHHGRLAYPPDVLAFSVEMVVGSHPDLPRLFLAPRIPLPVSQPTHIDAPFGTEMVIGWRPDRNREFLPLRVGWTISQITHDGAPIAPDMLAGWAPTRNREMLPLRVGLHDSQLTPVDVEVSADMVAGYHPDTSREVTFKLWSPFRQFRDVADFIRGPAGILILKFITEALAQSAMASEAVKVAGTIGDTMLTPDVDGEDIQ